MSCPRPAQSHPLLVLWEGWDFLQVMLWCVPLSSSLPSQILPSRSDQLFRETMTLLACEVILINPTHQAQVAECLKGYKL